MTEKSVKQLAADERLELFNDFVNGGEEAGYDLVELVRAAGHFLGMIMGKEAVAVGMTAMLSRVYQHSDLLVHSHSWEEMLDEVSNYAYAYWPLGERLTWLTAYALFGFTFPADQSKDQAKSQEQLISEHLEEAGTFLPRAPIDAWLHGTHYGETLRNIVLLAENRWALEQGQPIDPAALALFGGVTEARIRNLMAGASARFTSVDGKIPALEALEWLSDRESFFDSIWREQPNPLAYEPRKGVPQPIFLPVARDGSIFHPSLKVSNGFRIGPKGSERYVESFENALAELQRMDTPYWRRPNDKGKRGIVRGIRWERYDVSALPSFITPASGDKKDD